jgi:hypothetical protein
MGLKYKICEIVKGGTGKLPIACTGEVGGEEEDLFLIFALPFFLSLPLFFNEQ